MNNGEHKSDWFLKMNPSHKVPVLKDGKQKSQIDFGDRSCPHCQRYVTIIRKMQNSSTSSTSLPLISPTVLLRGLHSDRITCNHAIFVCTRYQRQIMSALTC